MDKHQFPEGQKTLLESLQMPFAVYQFIDKHVVTLALSDGFCKLFGYEDRALAYHDMDNDMYKDTHPDDVARIADAAFQFATEGGTYDVVYRTKRNGGPDYTIVHAIGKHVYTESGAHLAHVWYTDEGPYLDESDNQGTKLNIMLNGALHDESLVRASYYDFLTGLPSMTYFFELAEAGREAMLKEGENPALLYMDLSGMKFFNAQNGFAEGDKLLQAFAKALSNAFGNECSCHIGGDHFMVFSRAEGLEEKLARFFQDCQAINDGNNLPVRVGIYLDSMERVRVSTACDRAKFACDSLRNSYESAFSYYSQSLRDAEEHRRYILSNFDKAIDEGWIQVYYQPIVRAVNGRVCDEEALSRWIDPELGLLSPAEFIPVLEEAGFIYKLDLYLVDQVLEKIAIQQREGLHVVPHSINLSRSDFDSCDIVEEIRKRVDDAGIARDKITIEITESAVGSDFEFMREQIGRFWDLGFPVWMDDFGSGYSSLDFLQSIKLDLVKFDMNFMRRLDEGESGKIILTELMKMATALGLDTVCEGVETESQVRFLQEIGCSKLQGFYYAKPIPLEQILERYRTGTQIGYEDPEESSYYEAIGRVNLYDLAVISNEDDNAFQNFFNTVPMGIMEIEGDQVKLVRTNQSYRDFMERFYGLDLSGENAGYATESPHLDSSFMRLVKQCCDRGSRSFFDVQMSDGSTVHCFVRRVGTNSVAGKAAVAIAVLSVVDADQGTTYASIARALAANYYNLYYVNLETERFIEYSSPVGGEELAMERHGERFFEASRRDAMMRIHEGDREIFAATFTKENVLHEIDMQGSFTITYRLLDAGDPMYVNMKIMRMRHDGKHVIVGVSIIDSQMKRKVEMDRLRSERETLARVMALTGDYLSLYIVDPESGRYTEYSATSEYETLGIAKRGDDFFVQSAQNSETSICADDLPAFLQSFTKENIMRSIERTGTYYLKYRLMINGEPIPVRLKIALVKESSGDKLIAGVRTWRNRQ